MLNSLMTRAFFEPLAAPLVDEAVLSEILDELGREHALQMMQMVERDARKRLLALVDSMSRRDMRAIHVNAHALAGLLAHFGLARAAACSRALKAAPGVDAAQLEALQSACDKAFLTIGARLARHPKRAA